MRINNARGTALLEAAPVMILLAVFITGICLAAYLYFARAWIQYHSEQALYCASVKTTTIQCKYDLEEQLNRFLPWGESQVQIHATNDQWTVEVEWKYAEFSMHVEKTLTPKQILAAKALQW